MEAVDSSKTPVSLYNFTAWFHIPEDLNLQVSFHVAV